MTRSVIKAPITLKSPRTKNDIGKIIKIIEAPTKSPDFTASFPKRVAARNAETKPPMKRQIQAVIAESELGLLVLIRIKGDKSINKTEIAIPKTPPISETI